jgi:hypothetical protein
MRQRDRFCLLALHPPRRATRGACCQRLPAVPRCGDIPSSAARARHREYPPHILAHLRAVRAPFFAARSPFGKQRSPFSSAPLTRRHPFRRGPAQTDSSPPAASASRQGSAPRHRGHPPIPVRAPPQSANGWRGRGRAEPPSASSFLTTGALSVCADVSDCEALCDCRLLPIAARYAANVLAELQRCHCL